MIRHHDLEDMIEILDLAIARQEAEELFFRRSGNASTHDIANSLFLEIADDLKAYREKLEARKEKLLVALKDLGMQQGKVLSETKKKDAAPTRDPVCKMILDESHREIFSVYKGKNYYFCSTDCKQAFDLAPEKYLEN